MSRRAFCDGCGGLFDWPDEIRTDARYHSNACRQKSYRLRQKVRKMIDELGPEGAWAKIVADFDAVRERVTANRARADETSRNGEES